MSDVVLKRLCMQLMPAYFTLHTPVAAPLTLRVRSDDMNAPLRRAHPRIHDRHHALCHHRNNATAATLPVLIRPVYSLDCEFSHFDVPHVGEITLPTYVCLVDTDCQIVLKTHIRPCKPPAATFAGGVRPRSYANAPALEVVQQDILRVISGSTLVGLGVTNDLRKLGIVHPSHLICDLTQRSEFQGRSGSARSLARLTSVHLKREIQTAGRLHDPQEDAVAAMQLYLEVRTPLCPSCSRDWSAPVHAVQLRQIEATIVLLTAAYIMLWSSSTCGVTFSHVRLPHR
jgi:hypothetical protein